MAFGLLLVTFILLTAVLVGYLKIKSSQKSVPESSAAQVTQSPEELTTYEDQTQFSIRYPETLKLNPHEEDEENYAHVELTSDKYPGNLIVWVKDTAAEDIDLWVKETKVKGAIDSNLGGEKAVKVLSTSDSAKIVTSAIRDGYLYQIEANLADDYWNKINEIIVSSFQFTNRQKEEKMNNSYQETDTQDNTEGIYDEEEVIE